MIRSTTQRFLIAGGGTGGHVYPGLAVAEELQVLSPGCEVRFAGTRRGLEFLLVPRAGFQLYIVPASGFRGMGFGARFRFVLNFFAGLCKSLWLLLRWRPAVVLGTGGYVSAPVLAAASLLRRPTALQEQNAFPGSANRLLGRWARRIYLGFAAAAEYFPNRDVLVTGNPVRAGFRPENLAELPAEVEPPRAATANDDEELRVLVFGGSAGASTLNRAVAAAAARWSTEANLAIWVQTGPADLEAVREAFADFPDGRVRIDPYIFAMPAVLGWADLAVCRSGAMTLAELAAAGKPAILVPYPHATDDHQLKNARDCETAGAAVVLEDADCHGESLADRVAALAADRPRLAAMSQAAIGRRNLDAASRIARDIIALGSGTAATVVQEADHVS
ncbi:MAG: undecaprenyldiphospho-muramoylpentapeptide beta-N-acetylglucosaminyltransferase [bacterium]